MNVRRRNYGLCTAVRRVGGWHVPQGWRADVKNISLRYSTILVFDTETDTYISLTFLRPRATSQGPNNLIKQF